MGLKQDRVTAARLCGAAERLVRTDDTGAALAELHAISTDPAILTLAAVGLVDNDRWGAAAVAELLARAGADLDEARRIQAAQGPGWNPPQADPGKDRTT